MIGVPPTCGFFSKFYLIRGGIEGGPPEYVAALLISSLVNAVLFFRIFEIAYFGKNPADGHSHDHGHDDHDSHGHDHDSHGDAVTTAAPALREAPVYALIPLLAAAAFILLLGIFNGQIIELIRMAFENSATVVSNLR
jgi:multicomponent Na+:H+ antiporter subunit D